MSFYPALMLALVWTPAKLGKAPSEPLRQIRVKINAAPGRCRP